MTKPVDPLTQRPALLVLAVFALLLAILYWRREERMEDDPYLEPWFA